MARCTPCVAGRITPGVGSTSADQCVSPESNFITAIATLIVVAILSWEYIVRGRFFVVAFFRKQRVSLRLEDRAKAMMGYLYRYQYKGEAQRILVRSHSVIRVTIFLVLGTTVTAFATILAYFATLGRIVFKSMIIVVGLKIDIPFLSRLMDLATEVGAILNMTWLSRLLFSPFVHVIIFLARFKIDLDAINVTCVGSLAPMKLVVNVIAMAVVITVIMSDIIIFKSVTFDSLALKFCEIISSEAYYTWNPIHFETSKSRGHKTAYGGYFQVVMQSPKLQSTSAHICLAREA